jgi:hypothetical protein
VAALSVTWLDHWPHVYPGAIALHLAVVAALAVGVLFDDWLAERARLAGTIALLVLGLAAAFRSDRITLLLPASLVPWYPLVDASLLFGYGLLVRNRPCAAMGAALVAAWLASSGIQLYQQLRRIFIGLDQIASGLLFFSIAMAISITKAGMWSKVVPPKLMVWLFGAPDQTDGIETDPAAPSAGQEPAEA